MRETNGVWEDVRTGFWRVRFPSLQEKGKRAPTYNICTQDEYKKIGEKGISRLVKEMLKEKTEAFAEKKKTKEVAKLTEAHKHTVREAIDRYEREILSNRARHTQVGFSHHLKFWSSRLGSKTLAELETESAPLMIKDLRDSLKSKERSNTTLNRYLSALSAVLGRCSKDFLWMEKNPCSKIMKLEEPTHRIRYLLKQEQEDLLNACEGDLWDAVVMALKTGARKQEIWRLKFEDIDFKRNHIRLMETKSGKPRSIPMTQDLMEILQRRRVDINFTSHYVFPSPVNSNAPNNFERAWDTALKNSGIENFRWHDLRHTFASRAIMAGVTLRSLADLLGHSKVDMVFRYAHLSPQHLASSMELAGEEIGECKARVKKLA